MTITRVADNTQAQYLLNQINNASAKMDQSQAQVATGKVATDYIGYGDKTAALEAARSASSRATTYKAAAQTGLDRTNLQDTQLSTLSDLSNQLRQLVTNAVANNDATTLNTDLQGIFDQAVQILNSTDGSGNYLFGGDKDNTAPVTVTSLSALSAAPSAASVFANGTVKSSVTVGDGQTVTVGVLASDVGTQLLQTIKDIADFNAGANGPFGVGLTGTQSTFLSGEIQSTVAAGQTINNVAAANGDAYNRLQSALDHQDTLVNLYKNFTADIEDVDMGTAVANLNLNQTALQAALKVTSQLNQFSLLNYLK